MRIALIHYWLYGMRGGEKVIAEILKLFPNADIYTHLYVPENLDPSITEHKITKTFINSLPLSKKYYQAYLPLMPWALNKLDLKNYDLIISSESGPAKGVNKHKDACHICYCHTPMRYIWDQQSIYLANTGVIKSLYLRSITPYMRRWDVNSAKKVDHFIANSKYVSERIQRIYGTTSTVIHPPVDINSFHLTKIKGDYFVMAGQLVPYKRPELAILAFNQLKIPLKVIGTGEMLENLKKIAKSNIEFLGYVNDGEYSKVISSARALIFPGVEDFGIVPVEAQASGTPVIALEEGGALETVKGFRTNDIPMENQSYTGIFFQQPTVDNLISAVKQFEKYETIFTHENCQINARKFSKENFRTSFMELIDRILIK
tara:strand:+ start:1046 stop:2167 length:1122 start_codon:yes stop_codon:yes gene_type:complete